MSQTADSRPGPGLPGNPGPPVTGVDVVDDVLVGLAGLGSVGLREKYDQLARAHELLRGALDRDGVDPR